MSKLIKQTVHFSHHLFLISDTITGSGPLCNVYGEGGGLCSNKAPVGISENVRTILVDTAVIV